MNTSIQMNSYTMDSLYEIADIDSHISFLNQLTAKYQWDTIAKEKLTRDLALIENKKKDRHLNLTIIGEFSSGKSTFINALLRDNLLEADVIQGTTVASTMIRYAPKYDIIVNYKDGRTHRISDIHYGDLDNSSVKYYVKKITANEAEAKKMKEVIIEHPSPALKTGIVIIDTPGTNSTERWHEEVTKTAIQDISDVSIILMSADKPMSNTLISFIKQNLQEVLTKCVFVVTKMDLLREKERDRQLQYISQRITNEFGIHHPVLFPYTSLFVLGEADDQVKKEIVYTKNDYQVLIQESYQTETQIYQALMEQRIVIQIQKLLNAMEHTFTSISQDMENLSTSYQKNHDALMQATKRDLKDFTEEQKEKHRNRILVEANLVKQGIKNLTYQSVEEHRKSIEYQFFWCGSKKDFKTFIGVLFPRLLEDKGMKLVEGARKNYSSFDKIAQDEMNLFLDDFKKMYETLSTIIYNAGEFHLSQFVNQTSAVALYQTQLTSLVARDSKKEDQAYLGSAGAGAAIGTMLLPGVGTVIGGIVGVLFGAAITPPLNRLKANCVQQITTAMNDYFNRIILLVEQDMDSYINATSYHLCYQIDSYFNQYGELVNKMIHQDNTEKQQLQQSIVNIKLDLMEIDNRKYKITAILQKLNK